MVCLVFRTHYPLYTYLMCRGKYDRSGRSRSPASPRPISRDGTATSVKPEPSGNIAQGWHLVGIGLNDVFEQAPCRAVADGRGSRREPLAVRVAFRKQFHGILQTHVLVPELDADRHEPAPSTNHVSEKRSVDLGRRRRHIVVYARRGTLCGGPKGGWEFKVDARTYYWFRRGFNLIELFDDIGALQEIYIHIASRPELKDGVLKYTDYELDVVQRIGDIPRLVDLDEFHETVERLSLPVAFQSECYRSVSEALSLLAQWTWPS